MRHLKSLIIALVVGTSVTAYGATETTVTTTQPTDVSQTATTSDSTPTAATVSQTTTTTTKTVTTQPNQYKLGKMTCKQFLVIDESLRPKVVYWAIGHIKGKNSEMLDIDGVDRVIPMVVDECTANPEKSFWKTLKMKAKDLF